MNYRSRIEDAVLPRHRGRRRMMGSASALASLVLLFCSARANAALIAIARGGDAAPSSNGATFRVFDEPMVNANGDVVFGADLSDGGNGIYFMANGGSLTKIARDGDTVGALTLSSDFDGPAINDDGTVFFANFDMVGAVEHALFAKPSGGSLAAIVKQGDPAPGTSGTFELMEDMAVNPTKGDIAFIASYTEDSGSTFNEGVWLRQLINKKKGTTSLVNVVKSGDVLPGDGGGVVAADVGDIFSGCIDGPWLGDNRLVAFAVDCITNDVNSLEESVWARKGTGKIKPFILLNDTPPAALGGTISSIGIGRPGLVNNTIAAFLELSSGNVAAGLITKSLSAQTSKANVCVKSGDAAPATTGTFNDGLGNPTFNPSGNMEFHGEVDGGGSNFIGEFVCGTKGKSKGKVAVAALSGDAKPGGGSWVNLEEGSSSRNFIAFLDDNDDDPGVPVVGVFRVEMPTP